MLSDIRKAGLRQMLSALEEEPTKAFSAKEMREWAGPLAAADAERDAEEMASCNRDMQGALKLSNSAAKYARDVSKLIEAMRLAQNTGNKTLERQCNRKSETLAEGFKERVQEEDRHYFIEYQPDGANWDDRWHHAGEFYPPLLSLEAMGKLKPFPNPKGQAQAGVIRELLRDAGDDI